jgi:hypothetical protein
MFWIISSYSTFQAEPYDTREAAQARLGKIAEMDPSGFLNGAYWIVPAEVL